ncbi:ABC transporter permease [Jannaschia sp. R86511]|uniref:ABC transporter permease n=1 Tax=Jannaschia sp. R86511 TaxID=3093853 RepID=UPI0036D32AE4
MKRADVVGSAVRSTFRSRLRTSLTVIAIVIGAFTITITNGLGTGINAFISETVSAIGAENVLTVSRTPDDTTQTDEGIREYDPATTLVTDTSGPPGPGSGGTVEAITEDEIEQLRGLDDVESVERQVSVRTDFIRLGDDTAFEFSISSFVPGATLQLAAGDQLDDDSRDLELVIPVDYLDALSCDDADSCVGETATVGITDGEDVQHLVEAEIVGVAEAGLGTTNTGSANIALVDELYALQSTGQSETETSSYAAATVTHDPDLTDEDVTTLRDELTDLGYDSETVSEQIGTFRTVIDGVILVLNAFAAIALVAAGFGIVNTLLMSVQERTREIGLMKAVGLGGRKIFAMFSVEAVFIGFLGSVVGSVLGIVVGTATSGLLAEGLLGDLPGLTLIAFTPLSVLSVVALIMGIAFVAGTMPAVRAARKVPIEALRYE